jgi:putative membrane protein
VKKNIAGMNIDIAVSKDENELKKTSKASDHLANERTFLAWIRTSIGIMAFGFVVVKFSLFIKQISLLLGKDIAIHQHGYSSFIGIILVAVGALTTVLSYLNYARIKRQLNNNSFKSSSTLLMALTLIILLISVSLVTYLIQSV